MKLGGLVDKDVEGVEEPCVCYPTALIKGLGGESG